MANIFKVTNCLNGMITDNSQIPNLKENVQSFLITCPYNGWNSSDTSHAPNYSTFNIILPQSSVSFRNIRLELSWFRTDQERVQYISTNQPIEGGSVTLYTIHSKSITGTGFLNFNNLRNIYLERFECFGIVNKEDCVAYQFKRTINSQLPHFNDHLHMLCTIDLRNDSPVLPVNSEKKPPENFFCLFKEKVMTDFDIICENKKFSVHKAILTCQSAVFKAMLESQLKESQENKLEINDCEPSIVEIMIHYMYFNEIQPDLSVESLKQLFEIANKYQLQNLQMRCLQQICKSLKSISEVVDLMLFANIYNFTEFKDEMVQFIRDNRNTLL